MQINLKDPVYYNIIITFLKSKSQYLRL